MWKPDRSEKKPLYQQIADYFERRISYGELPPGSILPSERKLAEQFKVNRSTIVQAYDELRASGIIESTIGSGTRVSMYKWGIAPKHTPNWRQYVEGGTFLPNLPFLRRIREVLQKGNPIIDFASGELSVDLSANEAIRRLVHEHSFDEHLGYDDPQGYAPLREVLVSYLQHYRHIQATDSSILITSGSQQSLYLITHCLLSPGDAVAIEDPSYCYSLPMFQSAGLRLFRLPVEKQGIRPEDIQLLFRQQRIRMIFLNPNFQNPTGRVLDPSRRMKVLEIAADLGIPIVEDDPFSLTSYDGHPPYPLKSFDSSGIVLYLGSLSKVAASGLRTGWMVAPQSVVNRLADARQQMDFGPSVILQRIAAQFLGSDHFEQQIQRLRQALKKKREQLINSLQHELPNELTYTIPQGGLHLWCNIRHRVNDGKLLEEGIKRGVIFVPGSVYGSEAGYVRFTFARPKPEEIASGISKFAEALHASIT